MNLDNLADSFASQYHRKADHIFFCPGRVNLIGEHIDYNGGNVMPCAISKGTYLAVSKNTDKVFRFHCLNFPENAVLHLQSSYSKTGGQWFNYPLGVINEFLNEGYDLSGLDMLFYGDLPVGAGLSSSASIEVLTAFVLSELFKLNIPRKELALLSKKVENVFIGVNCGIMDQFAVAMGRKDNAILLNCDTLEFEYLPFRTGDYVLSVINTNKPRRLVESKYNERFAECGDALKYMKQEMDINCLCDVSPAAFEMNSHLIAGETTRKRALHVITENQRVKDATIALQTGDLETFGKLMYASHESLKVNYDVTGAELDCVIEFCKSYNDCIGARMTGAGFGGCAIALVHKNSAGDFAEKIGVYYKTKTGYAPEVFTTLAEDGVKEISF